ncbi:MAG: iron-containing alcohol dehydrogenase [Clostridium argentinense]|uniref:iron-containing alcohol dehydrogenase n=1 Tax=Clostridium butanoliproducens TaxID=2991837 RepID=UPI001DB8C402|nr:iron-containing alcohol dehydrogenase [Clostridium butanoliproducens]MBS5823114.1 iron-containing alcohol dehydrogenase [Clostridium argentinense]MDU1350366.1 iron-containing alcohol dehydrogenase [Clostridium argentinense]
MLNFVYNIPTQIFFGEGKIKVLGNEIKKYGSKVLIVYGGGTIKKTGLYDKVTNILRENNIDFIELPGVEPNPRITSVREGIKLCRENNVDFILAIGGGSVIDCSKFIAGGYYYDGDPWDFFIGKGKITNALPLASILTLAATGSEMNRGGVISNLETNQKLATGHPALLPKFSILDPTYTYTVPKNQTAAGVVDIMSHIFEVYFTPTKTAFLQNRMAEALLKTVFYYGPIAFNEPENYEARANLMWASSLAINGLLSYGKDTNWSVHDMEHELSAFYDITHGVGLGILTPVWMEYILDDDTVDDIANYGINVWNLDADKDKYKTAKEAINKTRDFIKSLGIPMTLREVGIEEEKLEVMAKQCAGEGTVGNYPPLTSKDILEIYKRAL